MNDEGMRLSISDIFHALYRSKMLILVLSIIGLGVGIVVSLAPYALGEISKEYTVKSSIAVTSVTEDGLFSTRGSNPSSTDILLAEQMVDSVIFVINSDTLLNQVIDRLGLADLSAGNIEHNLEMIQYNISPIIEVTLFWRSAEEGIAILSAINEIAPSVLVDTLKIGGVSVISDPVAKHHFGGSLNVSLWIYMSILGFMIGVAIVIVQMIAAPKLMNAKDMEQKFGLQVFGEIPKDKKGATNRVSDTFSASAHILYNQMKRNDYKILYITSANEAEGKTNIAANLALHLARRENKVLLVDFDIHNPTLGKFFLDKAEERKPLNALSQGDISPNEAITPINNFLDLLPACMGDFKLSFDEAVMEQVRSLAANYDFLLMDASPMGTEPDMLALNHISDAVLFVADCDSTGIREIRDSLEKLEKSGANTIGCIVNGVR